MRQERHPVPGEGNMVYPDPKVETSKDNKEEVPVQGEIEDPKKGLQVPEK